MSRCDTETGTCETKQPMSPSRECTVKCPCGTDCADPVDCALSIWGQSFFRAMQEVQTDLLKARIQKAWGAKMEKAADAVVEAMGTKWQSMLAASKAKQDVRQKLQSLWQEGR